MRLPDLPVAEAVEPLKAALTQGSSAVLIAPPGAGKTTVVPLALLGAEWLGARKIVMLEPRRLATRAAARRMADLVDEAVGGTVGYRIRRDTQVSDQTRIEVVTEGVLTRMLQSDPSLDGIGLVIFDEFHERSLNADLGLALTLQAQRLLREDLRILVMSATLDAAPVAALLDASGSTPTIEAEGRVFPVETRYLERSRTDRIEPAVAARTAAALRDDEGDVLVFLPGVAEIRRTEQRLRDSTLDDTVDVYPLFGDLSREEQDRAIAPSPAGRRKVVLASAIAQTSLTIDGVRTVIDSGLMRVPRFDPRTGMAGLETLRVTADVADQRRGRAGRTAPGVCHRLWTQAEQRGLVPQQRAEILDADLGALTLELALWGADPQELDWLDPPPAAALQQARVLLQQLEALDAAGDITDHGRAMCRVGLHPRLAHMLLHAKRMKLAAVACDVAALLGERDVLRRDGERTDADARLRLEALRRGRRRDGAIAGHTVHRGRLYRVQQEARSLRRSVGIGADVEVGSGDIERAGELLALAYPDRVGRRRDTGASNAVGGIDSQVTSYLLRGGRGVELARGQSLSQHEWIVVSDVGDRGRVAHVYQAAPIDGQQVEKMFRSSIIDSDEVDWNPETGRVDAARRRRLGSIVVSESSLSDADPQRVAQALLEGVRSVGIRALPWSKKTTQLRERLQFMHVADPEGWTNVSDEALMASLETWLLPFVSGMRRLNELSSLDLVDVLWTHVGWQQRAPLEDLAPTHLEVPSGSRIPLDYTDPQAPALAVRLQEVFGWTDTPRIGGGRTPITIRLLSPAQRPVQVTSDLANFWRTTYFEVKRELKGRYPKHYWPDDPLTAQPTHRVRPK